MDAWAVFTFIGTISFSLQGGMIAMEKNYDLFGVYLFGILTAFGGGAIRNTLIDTSDYELWNQAPLFYTSIISITLILIFPKTFLEESSILGEYLRCDWFNRIRHTRLISSSTAWITG